MRTTQPRAFWRLSDVIYLTQTQAATPLLLEVRVRLTLPRGLPSTSVQQSVPLLTLLLPLLLLLRRLFLPTLLSGWEEGIPAPMASPRRRLRPLAEQPLMLQLYPSNPDWRPMTTPRTRTLLKKLYRNTQRRWQGFLQSKRKHIKPNYLGNIHLLERKTLSCLSTPVNTTRKLQICSVVHADASKR